MHRISLGGAPALGGVGALSEAGEVEVITTDRRGLTPEEWADLAMRKFISVSAQAPAPLRMQAEAYREKVRALFVAYMRNAVLSDRTTIINFLTEAGHPELAEAVRSL